MPSYIIATKLILNTLELPFHTHFVCVTSRNLYNWDRITIYFWFKSVCECVFGVYGSYAHCNHMHIVKKQISVTRHQDYKNSK